MTRRPSGGRAGRVGGTASAGELIPRSEFAGFRLAPETVAVAVRRDRRYGLYRNRDDGSRTVLPGLAGSLLPARRGFACLHGTCSEGA
jgi:hypothetical protein